MNVNILNQIVVEAGSETKRLIPAKPGAVEAYGAEGLYVSGLERIASLPPGSDYSGVTQELAEELLDDHYRFLSCD